MTGKRARGLGNKTRQQPRRTRHALLAWWSEVVWCALSVACIATLVSVVSVYNHKPLPEWPLGLTLNTVIAFISTICRTAFVVPVMEGLSQSKWNWFKRYGPRPLEDFQIFDEASRGPWGSLKLLLTMKGRLIAVLSAAVLVTGIATSTVTQSVVTYPTRQVLAEGASTPLTKRNDKYAWATANMQFIGITMYPVYQAVLKGLATPPAEEVPYYQASCSTGMCTWPAFSSLAICVDAKSTCMYLTTPDDPGNRSSVGGLGSHYTRLLLKDNLVGAANQKGELTLRNRTEIFSTEVLRSTIGIPLENNPEKDQMNDDARFFAVKRLTQNLASQITNALLDLNHTGLAWRNETYVHVRWPWLTLLVVQVGLSVLTFVLVVVQTAGLDIEIVNGSSLPALLAVKADEKASLLNELRDEPDTTSKSAEPVYLEATGITRAFQRSGRGWTLEDERDLTD
ncbi:hypothetical protein CPLU01_13755 [Colletotrichum plurivorum]|uniref:Uncharacterized protein n=1 Tax=Colletotrichum plurivorum TaxID=2175906 RepID=A0A8H6JQC4_9PEZI|nr:hypothetical protein CPLU01_13755 [Colletotrichum plurivorum]